MYENIKMPSNALLTSGLLFLWSLPYLQPLYWFLEWGQVLTPYVPLFICVAFFFIKKTKLEQGLLGFFLILSTGRLLDYSNIKKESVYDRTSVNDQNSFCLISANLLTQNKSPERAVKEIQDFICSDRPNVLVAIEVNKKWVDVHLKEIEDKLPLVSSKPQENNFGMAVYSNLQFEEFEWINLGSKTDFPAFHAFLPKGAKVLSLYGVHIMPPLSAEKSDTGKENRKKFFEIFDGDRSKSKIVAGDFNATPGSWALGEFEQRKLRIASNGHFISFTWKLPMMPWAWFDHILLSEDLSVARVETSKEFGSDHRMIKAIIEW